MYLTFGDPDCIIGNLNDYFMHSSDDIAVEEEMETP